MPVNVGYRCSLGKAHFQRESSILSRQSYATRCYRAQPAATSVLNYEWLTQSFLQPMAEQTREHIPRTSRGKTNDPAHRPRRIGLRADAAHRQERSTHRERTAAAVRGEALARLGAAEHYALGQRDQPRRPATNLADRRGWSTSALAQPSPPSTDRACCGRGVEGASNQPHEPGEQKCHICLVSRRG
jgi:hypothetical protein